MNFSCKLSVCIFFGCLFYIHFVYSEEEYPLNQFYTLHISAGDACNRSYISGAGLNGRGCGNNLITGNGSGWSWFHCQDDDGNYYKLHYNYCSVYGPLLGEYKFNNTSECPSGTAVDSSGVCIPSIKNQGQVTCPSATADTNPINLGVGNKYQIATDYLGHSVYPLVVRRTFNSVSTLWQFHSQINVAPGLIKAIVVRADGKNLTFPSNGSGGWISDPDVTGFLQSFEDTSGNITSWRYTTLDQQIEDYDATGRLTAITHRSGLSHTYTYTASDITVTHSEGDVLTYQLDTTGRIVGFTGPDNHQYTYNYDTEDRLTGITYPNSGGTRIYHYEDINYPNALTGITDANGDRFATWTYDNLGRAISSSHHNNADLVTIDYIHLNDAIDPRATATNPLGKQTTYHFTTIHGVRKVTQVEGHPSNNCAAANKAYTYDANGFLETKTDWQGNITRYTRNTKGQELTRTEAEGTAVERTISTEWHSTFNVPTKITEPEQEITFTYDANGNQLTRVVTDLP